MMTKELLLVAIPLAIVVISQLIKGVLQYRRGVKNKSAFTMNGGFPSSHTAFVTSLITVIGYQDGIKSTTFTIALVLAIIIVHDAINVRIHIGKNGKAINQLLRTLKKDSKYKTLKNVPESLEITGHHLHEIVGGALIGTIGTILILFLVKQYL